LGVIFILFITSGLEAVPAEAYRLNHPNTVVLQKDIRDISISELKKILGKEKLHLISICLAHSSASDF